ncbi:DUF883 family protein [Reyranella massiliensis]|uniref:DUF883 family protein n=1 Tax=Reyranella massiliensis TaxID=445220 RepID=UPI0002DDF8BE|nr:DUF883 family protein [Reyranella massiliensis]
MEKGVKDTYGYLGTEPMKLREQLEQLAAAFEEMAKAESSEAAKGARDAARRIAKHAGALAEQLANSSEEVEAAVAQGRRQVEEAIRVRPWAAVAMAAATGFLLAMLVRR